MLYDYSQKEKSNKKRSQFSHIMAAKQPTIEKDGEPEEISTIIEEKEEVENISDTKENSYEKPREKPKYDKPFEKNSFDRSQRENYNSNSPKGDYKAKNDFRENKPVYDNNRKNDSRSEGRQEGRPNTQNTNNFRPDRNPEKNLDRNFDRPTNRNNNPKPFRREEIRDEPKKIEPNTMSKLDLLKNKINKNNL